MDNGNGDGRITFDYYEAPNNGREAYQAWLHLSLSGLLNTGEMTGYKSSGRGYSNSGSGTLVPGVNTMRSGYEGVAWGIHYAQSSSSQHVAPNPYTAKQGNALWIGGGRHPKHSSPLFTPAEIYNFEMKMDDGKPLQGKIQVPYRLWQDGVKVTGCHSLETEDSEYLLTDDTPQCMLYFYLQQ